MKFILLIDLETIREANVISIERDKCEPSPRRPKTQHGTSSWLLVKNKRASRTLPMVVEERRDSHSASSSLRR